MGVDKNVLLVSSVGVVAVLGLVVLMLGGGGTTGNSIETTALRTQLAETWADSYYHGDLNLAQQIAECVIPRPNNYNAEYGKTAAGDRSVTRHTREECEVQILGAPFTVQAPQEDVGVANRELVAKYQAADNPVLSRSVQSDIENCVNARTRLGLSEAKARDYCTCLQSTSDKSKEFCYQAASLTAANIALLEGQPAEAGRAVPGRSYVGQKSFFPTGNIVNLNVQCMSKPQYVQAYPEENIRDIFCRCKTATKDGECDMVAKTVTPKQIEGFNSCMQKFKDSEFATASTELKHAWKECSAEQGFYARN